MTYQLEIVEGIEVARVYVDGRKTSAYIPLQDLEDCELTSFIDSKPF